MTAICPAGPPKVCHEIANHTRAASRNEITSPAPPAFPASPMAGTSVLPASGGSFDLNEVAPIVATRCGGPPVRDRR